jgi:hypothetical protein
MPKQLNEIKEASNQLARRAKLGQLDEKTLFALFNDLVNTLAAKELAANAPQLQSSGDVGMGIPAESLEAPAPKKRGRKPKVEVPAPVEEATAEAPAASDAPGSQKTIPLNLKVGRGVSVGTRSVINTGVTVGSAPVSPAGQVTVGGRPRKV